MSDPTICSRKLGQGEAGAGARIAALHAFCEAQIEWARGQMKPKTELASSEMRAVAEELFMRSVTQGPMLGASEVQGG